MTAHTINGRPRASMSLVIGLAAHSPTCESFRLVSSSATEATWETRRTDSASPDPIRFTITLEAVEGSMGTIAKAHPERWLCRVAAYRLACLVYRTEIDASLGLAGIDAP